MRIGFTLAMDAPSGHNEAAAVCRTTLESRCVPMESRDGSTKRFQFSLADLLMVVTGVAVGCSFAKLKDSHPDDGLFAAAVAWIVYGLIRQIRDLGGAYRKAAGLSPDQRWGWRFAMAWRADLTVVFIGCLLTKALVATDCISLSDGDASRGQFWGGGSYLRESLLALALFVVLAASGPRPLHASKRRTGPVLMIFAAVAAALLGLIVWCDELLVCHLVNIACMAIEFFAPSRNSLDAIQAYSLARAWTFLIWSALSAGLLVADMICIRWLVRCWAIDRRARWLAGGCLAISLALTAIYPFWIMSHGLRDIAPRMAEFCFIGPIHRWVTWAIIVLISVTAGAWRVVSFVEPPPEKGQLNWRRGPVYVNERPILAFLVAGTILLHEAFLFRKASMWLSFMDWWSLLSATIVPDGLRLLWFAVLLLALYQSIPRWRKPAEPLPAGPRPLPIGLFSAVWIALLATLLCALPIIAGLSFGIWLNAWRFRWF